MGVLIKKLNKIQVPGNFWPAVYVHLIKSNFKKYKLFNYKKENYNF